ncbi:MAG: hypothetical protein IMZ55_07420 [Acidobacteria bacterium]|nr:hypothetical protein [Acidobacteriota bacterium]
MAGNTGAIRAGKAFVEIYTKDSMKSGLDKAAARLKKFGASVTAAGRALTKIGGAALTGLVGMGKLFASTGDNLQEMSQRTGVSVEALQELGYAAKLSGSSTEDLEKSLRRMQSTIFDAGKGMATAEDALDALGLSAAQLVGKSPEAQFALIADRLDGVQDSTTKAALAMDIFGRSGAGILPMIQGGAAGLSRYAAEARALGIVMSTEDADAAAKLADEMDKLWFSVKMTGVQIGAALAPALMEVAKWLKEAAASATAWVKEHKDLIVTALKVAAAVTAVGVSLLIIGKTVVGIAAICKVMAALQIAAKGVGVAMTFLAANPVVLVLGALAGVLVGAAIAGRMAAAEIIKLDGAMRQAREGADAKRTQDLDLMKRLEVLGDKWKLTSAEMSEAKDIIGQLTGRYGDLGIAINSTTGKIEGLDKAHSALVESMRSSAISQIDAELAEHQRNIEALGKQSDDRSMPWSAAVWMSEKERRAIAARGRAEYDAMAALGDRRKKLMGGGESDLGSPANTEKAKAETIQRIKATAEAEKEWTEKIHNLRLQAIEDEHARALALMDARYNKEAREAMAAGAGTEALYLIREAREQELANLEKARQKSALDTARSAINARNAADRDQEGTNEELRLRTTMKGVALETALLDLQKRQALEAAGAAGLRLDLVEREFDLRKLAIDRAASEADRDQKQTNEELHLRTIMKGVALEHALLNFQRRQALEAAAKAGLRLDLVEREFVLRRKLLDAAVEPIPSRSIIGAAAMQSLQGSKDSVAERTARATEATEKNTRKLREYHPVSFL